jgi:hypothetical protein
MNPPKPLAAPQKGEHSSGRQNFRLDAKLPEGKVMGRLVDAYKEASKPKAARVQTLESLAGAMAHFYAYRKPEKTLRELGRLYTGLADLPEARVQPLNTEVRLVDAAKRCEEALLWATKAMVGALTAVVPILELAIQRGASDPEMDAHAEDLLNGVKMLISGHVKLTSDRIINVSKVVGSQVGRDITKARLDPHEDAIPTEHLLGENLAEQGLIALSTARATDFMGRGRKRQGDFADGQNKRLRPALSPRGGRSYSTSRGAYGSGWTPRPGFGSYQQPRRFERNQQTTRYPTRGARARGTPSTARGYQK